MNDSFRRKTSVRFLENQLLTYAPTMCNIALKTFQTRSVPNTSAEGPAQKNRVASEAIKPGSRWVGVGQKRQRGNPTCPGGRWPQRASSNALISRPRWAETHAWNECHSGWQCERRGSAIGRQSAEPCERPESESERDCQRSE